MPSVRSIVRSSITSLFAILVSVFVIEFAIELAREHGIYEKPTETLEAIVTSTIFTNIFWLITGLTIGIWLDWMLSKHIGGHFLKRISLDNDIKPAIDPQERRLDYIESVTFDNKTVNVDNKHFIKCHFKNNCTFKYEGGPFRMDDCTSDKTTHAFGTYNLGIGGAVAILRMIGFVRENAICSMIDVPNYPNL